MSDKFITHQLTHWDLSNDHSKDLRIHFEDLLWDLKQIISCLGDSLEIGIRLERQKTLMPRGDDSSKDQPSVWLIISWYSLRSKVKVLHFLKVTARATTSQGSDGQLLKPSPLDKIPTYGQLLINH